MCMHAYQAVPHAEACMHVLMHTTLYRMAAVEHQNCMPCFVYAEVPSLQETCIPECVHSRMREHAGCFGATEPDALPGFPSI